MTALEAPVPAAPAPFAPTWPPPPAVPLSGHLGDRLRRATWLGLAARGARAGLSRDDLALRPWRFAEV